MTRLTLATAVLTTAAALTCVTIPFVSTMRGASSSAVAAGQEQDPGTPPPRRAVPEFKKIAVDSDHVLSLAYSPGGKTLVTAGFQGAIELWDVIENKKVGAFKGERSVVGFVTFAPEGKTLASVGNEGTVKLWDVRDGTLKRTFPNSSETIRQVVQHPDAGPMAFAPDGLHLAVSASAQVGGYNM